jgi:hypothetical protein
VRLLHELGADVKAAMADGGTSVFIASQHGQVKTVRLLHDLGADVNAATANGCTPVYIASQQGHVKTVQLLHELGADVKAVVVNGCTPLSVASEMGHAETVWLLRELGADLNIAAPNGATPLTFACITGRLATVRTLCMLGAERSANLILPGAAQPTFVSVEMMTQNVDILQFLRNTTGFLNPLQYSVELTMEEARYWLQSEKLRDFPQFDFLNHGSATCNFIQSALVWSKEAADLFPPSCRRRARELVLIPWFEKRLGSEIVTISLLPLVIDRYS